MTAFLLLGFRQDAAVPGTWGSTWALLLMVACGAVWVLTALARRTAPTALDGAWVLAASFWGASLLSYGWAFRTGLPPGAEPSDMDASVLLQLITLLFFGFLLARVSTLRSAELVLRGLVAGATLSATYALVDLATAVDFGAIVRLPLTRASGDVLVDNLMRAGMLRAQGAAGHPLELATVAALTAPLAVGMAFAERTRGRRWWPWALSAVILLAAALTSLARSALISCVLAFLVMAAHWTGRRIAATLGGALVALLAVAAARPSVYVAFAQVFLASGQDDSLYSREFGRDYALELAAGHPILGIGTAAYSVPFHPVLDNQYLSRLVEGGALGLVTFVALLVAAGVQALRAARRFGHLGAGAGREIAVGLAGAMTALLVSNAVLDTSGFRQAWTVTWFLLALCWGVSRAACSSAVGVADAAHAPDPARVATAGPARSAATGADAS
ncbi:MAG: O-antigen ligase family protein [Dermatophilaceae bacterium]